LTEPWGDDCSSCEVDTFQHFALNRQEKALGSTGPSGGLVIYLRRELCCADTFAFERDDTHLWVKINGELFNIDGHLFIALCYPIYI
jgi:hypothetical protein